MKYFGFISNFSWSHCTTLNYAFRFTANNLCPLALCPARNLLRWSDCYRWYLHYWRWQETFGLTQTARPLSWLIAAHTHTHTRFLLIRSIPCGATSTYTTSKPSSVCYSSTTLTDRLSVGQRACSVLGLCACMRVKLTRSRRLAYLRIVPTDHNYVLFCYSLLCCQFSPFLYLKDALSFEYLWARLCCVDISRIAWGH